MADEADHVRRFPYGKIGAFASVAYVVIVVGLLVWGGKPAPWFEDSNEFGDFLAGFAAPLAFGWLVLGFFQQGEELRLQAAELRASVEQASKQAEALSISAEHTRFQAIAIMNSSFEKRLADSIEALLKVIGQLTSVQGPNNQVGLGKPDYEGARKRFADGDQDAFFEQVSRFEDILDRYSVFDHYVRSHPDSARLLDAATAVCEELDDWIDSVVKIGGEKTDIGRAMLLELDRLTEFRSRVLDSVEKAADQGK